MGDRESKQKGGDSLGGKRDPKTRTGGDAITSAKDEPEENGMDKGTADPKIGKVEPKPTEEDRP